MTWMDSVSALMARKSSRAGAAVAAVGLAPARWTPRRYDRLAEEGYRKNVVAYRCVREVARACASVPWLLYKGPRELDRHPLLDLLRRPNPRQSGPELIEAAISHLLLSGNAYLEVVSPDSSPPREIYALRPDRMRIAPDVSGVPRAYRYEVEGRSIEWPVDPITGASDVLHLRDFHPLDDWYGLSPIEAAAAAIDQHNAAAEHNAALLQNGARPSGALVFRSDPGPDGIRRVEEALLDRTQGPRQAGRPLVLGGDVDWKELGFSPKDMDFAQMKAQAAREIAAAFGVPHLLVVAGEATYSNRADARLELWEHTVISLLDRLSSALTTWLAPMFSNDLRLAHDLDEVPALAPRRRLKWQQIQAADFLTVNEKRAALGYEPVDKRDAEIKDSRDYERIQGHPQPRVPVGSPDGGQWTSGPSGDPRLVLLRGPARGGPTRPFQPARPGIGRGGAGRGGSGGGNRRPPINPFPDKPHCEEQWREAFRRCHEEFKKPNYQRSPLMYGRDFAECVDGLVSEECGGNPVGGRKQLGNELYMSQKSTSIDDESEPPVLERAREAWRADRFEAAIGICTEYLRANPPHFSAYVWRAHSLHALERYEEALDDWATCIELFPDRDIPYFHLAENLHSLDRYEEAIDAYNRAEARFPDFNMHTIKWYRALCFVALGRFAEAKRDMDRLPTDRNIFKRARADLMKRMARDY